MLVEIGNADPVAKGSRDVRLVSLPRLFIRLFLQYREFCASELIVDALHDDFGCLIQFFLDNLLLLLITYHLPNVLVIVLLVHALLGVGPHRNVVGVTQEPVLLNGCLDNRLSDFLLPNLLGI